MPRPEHTEDRRRAASGSRASRALAQAALDTRTVDMALRTLDWQQDKDLAFLVREVGPTLAAPELVVALDETARSRLRSSEVYSGLVDRLQAKLPHEEALSEPPSDGSPSVGVALTWRELAEKIGFLPVLDDLAVLVHDSTDPGSFEGAVRRVEDVATRLDQAGREHSAIALAAIELPDEVATAIFEAGAQLLVVAPSFMELSDAERISNLQSLLDDEPYEPPSEKPEHGVDEGLYDKPNPALTSEELSDWERRFEQSDKID